MPSMFKRGLVAALAIAPLLHSASAVAQSLTFTTFAGRPEVRSAIDATGSEARFNKPISVATDSSGNIYVTENASHTIRKITPAGAVTTLAGLAGDSGSTDGTGNVARFYLPEGAAVDSSGNVYVADYNNTIRKISPAGVVTTLAGLAGTSGSADGTGSAARFDHPKSVATDSGGNVYVADYFNFTIRKITPSGAVTTLAGVAGTSGSADGTGSAASFGTLSALATDSSGNIYAADSSRIRKITPTGVVTTVTVPGASFNPRGLALDKAGNIYITDSYSVRKITPAGAISTLAGGDWNSWPPAWGDHDGTGSAAQFNEPIGITVADDGTIYVADRTGGTIRKVTPTGTVTTLAGISSMRGSDDGVGTAARFDRPGGIATDGSGNIYVPDYWSHVIRKITPAGAVTTLAGQAWVSGSADGTGSAARFYYPRGLAADSSGNVYVADSGNQTIRKITPAGTVTTLAGLAGSAGASTDGTGNTARFYYPEGIAVDSNGNVYVADNGSGKIRKVTQGGVVTTLPPSFFGAEGVALDSSGNIYVAGAELSKIAPNGTVTTLPGTFGDPAGVAVDGGGNVYVTDYYYSTVSKITPGGVVTTLGGLAGKRGTDDGTGSGARFDCAFKVAVDRSGNVYVADTYRGDGNSEYYSNTIRLGRPTIADTATIDAVIGQTGATRQLGTSAQTATSYRWEVIRRPVNAAATLSSTTVRNPTFTPDVPGLFRFRLLAESSAGAAISTVDLLSSALPPAMTTLTTSPNPSNYGTTVTFTATLTSGATGVVEFHDGTSVVGAATLNGSTATYSTSTLSVGTHSITTLYTGDASSGGSISAPLTHTVNRAPTTIALTSNYNPALWGNTVTFKATLPGGATGSVTFMDGTTTLGTQTLSGGSASLGVSTFSVGSHSITAVYGGDTNYLASTSTALTQTVNKALTLTGVKAASNPSYGGAVLTATVTDTLNGLLTLATGSVTFKEGTTVLGTAPLSAAKATFAAALAVGTHSITAAYGGDANFNTSTSRTLTLTVNAVVKGDVNADGLIGPVDVFYLINNLFAGGPAPIGSADANGDGLVNPSDVFYLISYLFGGGPAPK